APPPAPTSPASSGDAGAVNEGAYGYERYEPSEDDPYHGEPYEAPAAAPENYGSSQPGQSLVQQSVEAPGLAGHQQTIDVRPETPSAVTKSSQPPPPPPPPSTPDDEEEDDEEEEGMLRMSFMEHLEELRARILKALVGVGVAFVVCLLVADPLWRIVSAPAIIALKHLHYNPQLVAISPMEQFSIIWVKMPLLVSLFVASPWCCTRYGHSFRPDYTGANGVMPCRSYCAPRACSSPAAYSRILWLSATVSNSYWGSGATSMSPRWCRSTNISTCS